MYSQYHCTLDVQCSAISLVINNSLVEILSQLFPMMITIHQRNQNVSNDDDTFSKSAQNSLPSVLPDKYITDRLTIQLILSLLALFSLFLPSTNKSLFEKSNVLPSPMTNNSSMNRISISNSTYVQICCAKYIPLLCLIWPQLLQKSSLFYQQSLRMIQTRVLIHNIPWWQDQSYSSANYVHCSAKLSVNVHNSQFPYVQLTSVVELLDFWLRVVTWVRSDWAPM